jgi:hypothetical protein
MLHSSNKANKGDAPAKVRTQSQTGEDVAPEHLPNLGVQRQFTPQHLMQLQSTIGNQAVQRLIAKGAIQREGDDEGNEAESEQEETSDTDVEGIKQDAEALKGGETMLGQTVPITGDLLKALNPSRSTDPKIKKKHRSDYEVKEVKGKAFLSDNNVTISPSEIKQGALGDCYLLSAMAAIAQANPQYIRDLIKGPNKDGSYDVTLYIDKGALWWKKKSPIVINVQPTFPQDKSGNMLYGDSTRKDNSGNKQLWPMLIEKAYAKHKGEYSDIEGGFGDDALSLLTGKEAKREFVDKFTNSQILSTLKTFLKNGYAVTVSTRMTMPFSLFGVTKEEFDNAGAVSRHEYSLIDVDSAAETVDIRNPWGEKHLRNMSIADFRKFFQDFSSVKL